MDATTKKLVRLLEGGDLELRMAAMRVVAELGVGGAAAVRSLGRALREAPQALKLLALRGLRELGGREVVQQVIPLLSEHGELREEALQVVARVGEPAVPGLIELYKKSEANTRRAVATALSEIRTPAAFEFIFSRLQEESFDLQKHLSQCLSDAIDELPPSRLNTVFKQTRDFVDSPKTRRDIQALVIGIILLGRFRARNQIQQVRKTLCAFGDKKHPPEVRRYALIALNSTLDDAPVRKELVTFLENCLRDPDWSNVAQHALQAFERIDVAQKPRKFLSLLKDSPHHGVHLYVFERLAQEDRPEVVRAIIPFLGDSSYRVRDAAEKALRNMKSAVKELLETIADSDDLDLGQRISNMLSDYPIEERRRVVSQAVDKFLLFFEGHDRRATFFLDFVRGVDPAPLRKALYDRVEKLRKRKTKDRWEKIARYLQVLWDQHLITPEGRFLFALALIKESKRDLSPQARQGNLGLQVMRALIYDNPRRLVKRLGSTKDLDSDDLFYIGFHFIEEGEELRPFATSLLKHVISKHPRSRAAKVAKEKLEMVAKLEESPPVTKKRSRSRRVKPPGRAELEATKAESGTAKSAAAKKATRKGPKKAEKSKSSSGESKAKAGSEEKSKKKASSGSKKKPAKAKKSSSKSSKKKPSKKDSAKKKSSKKGKGAKRDTRISARSQGNKKSRSGNSGSKKKSRKKKR